MSPESGGYAIALARIADEKKRKTGFLDLGTLGLDHWPQELWQLNHLVRLNLGAWWHEYEEMEPDFEPNQLNPQEAQWSSFPSLKHLYIRGMGWANLGSLHGLVSLQHIDCSINRLTTLEPLAGLSSLHSLACHSNRVTTLEPLAGLSSLHSLNCSGNQLTTLEPLAGLSSLKSLECSGNQLTTLEPLAGLSSLRSLECHSNGLTTLEPLAALSSLRSIDCSDNELSTLEPLSGLSSLSSLNCCGNRLTTLDPLKGLSSLRSVKCSGNRLTTLEPLEGLPSLQSLHCSRNPLSALPLAMISGENFQELVIFNTAVPEIPVEVLSENEYSCCLQTLRSHLCDMRVGTDLLPDVKVMVLGNGRIGKTQLCNRLRGLPFEKDADSTHGITVASQEFGPDTLLRLWDFGGQDIYHGTHALFMQSRTILVLVWTPDSENSETHEHGGMTFRNRPLAWWLAWVRHLAGPESPVLVVRNQCDLPQCEQLPAPLSDGAMNEFPFHRALNYSALNQCGTGVLQAALRDAVDWLREGRGQTRIGKGRLAVKARLDDLLAKDAAIADISQRRHRTLSIEQYEAICAECGGVSSPPMLLDYLYRSGVLFYKRGLFRGRIILDQGWALEAVYAVFNRKACYQQLKWLKGRFTRTLLESLVWRDYKLQEQELFLDLMQSCGICFVHREGNPGLHIEREYLAPDLLPDYAEVETDVEARWNKTLPCDERTLELPFLHLGVMRSLLSRIGNAAGMAAVYWKDGVCLYEKTTASRGRIEQRLQESATEWRGFLVVRTQGGRSEELLSILWKWAMEAVSDSGLHAPPLSTFDHGPSMTISAAETVPVTGNSSPESAAPDVDFGSDPKTGTTYAVSYAWREESVEIVERLCAEAAGRGIHILRDVTDLGLGERISSFMKSIARRDRVFVILSDRYLRSESCMFELKEVWRWCREDEESFHRQVCIFQTPGLDISDFECQLAIAEYWVQKHKSVKRRVVDLAEAGKLTEPLLRRFNNLNAFAEHAGIIVPYIADRLRPRDFAEFVKHGFSEPVSLRA